MGGAQSGATCMGHGRASPSPGEDGGGDLPHVGPRGKGQGATYWRTTTCPGPERDKLNRRVIDGECT